MLGQARSLNKSVFLSVVQNTHIAIKHYPKVHAQIALGIVRGKVGACKSKEFTFTNRALAIHLITTTMISP